MSNTENIKFKCPNCGKVKKVYYHLTVSSQDKDIRDLLLTDEINVFKCPKCKEKHKLPFSILYTNAELSFAAWWEPSYDELIDRMIEGTRKFFGRDNWTTMGPRIKDWDEFKEYIIINEQEN